MHALVQACHGVGHETGREDGLVAEILPWSIPGHAPRRLPGPAKPSVRDAAARTAWSTTPMRARHHAAAPLRRQRLHLAGDERRFGHGDAAGCGAGPVDGASGPLGRPDRVEDVSRGIGEPARGRSNRARHGLRHPAGAGIPQRDRRQDRRRRPRHQHEQGVSPRGRAPVRRRQLGAGVRNARRHAAGRHRRVHGAAVWYVLHRDGGRAGRGGAVRRRGLRRLGERSRGTLDAGPASCSLLLAVLADGLLRGLQRGG